MTPDIIKEYHKYYLVTCSECKSKVLDPDKKKNQEILKGKCPSCGNDSKPPPKKSKNNKSSKKEIDKSEFMGKYSED